MLLPVIEAAPQHVRSHGPRHPRHSLVRDRHITVNDRGRLRRELTIFLIHSATRRGDHPGAASTNTVIDLVFGLTWSRLLAADGTLCPAQVCHLLDAIAPATPRGTP